MLHGITVELEQKTEAGRDDFNRPVFISEFVNVDNVLVGSPSAQEVTDTLNLTGKRIEFVLGIPKGDAHDWLDKRIRFFGREFKAIGFPETGIQDLIPLEWGSNLKVERYG